MAHKKFQPLVFQKPPWAQRSGLGTFGTLPPEVRLMIYRFLYDNKNLYPRPLTYWCRHITRADGLRKLLHVSKQLREEIVATLSKSKLSFRRSLDFGHTYSPVELQRMLLDDETADMIPNFSFFIDMDSGTTDMLPDWESPWDKRKGYTQAVIAFNRLAHDTIVQAARPGVNRGKIIFDFHSVHRGMCGFLLSSHMLKYLGRLVHFEEVRFRLTVRDCYRKNCCPPLSEDKSLAVAVMKQLGDSLKPHFGVGRRRVSRTPKRRGRGIVDRLLYIFWPREHQQKLRDNPKLQSKSRTGAQQTKARRM